MNYIPGGLTLLAIYWVVVGIRKRRDAPSRHRLLTALATDLRTLEVRRERERVPPHDPFGDHPSKEDTP